MLRACYQGAPASFSIAAGKLFATRPMPWMVIIVSSLAFLALCRAEQHHGQPYPSSFDPDSLFPQ